MEYSTLDEFISKGSSTTLTYYKLSLKTKLDDIIYSIDNVLYDYIDELKSISKPVEFNDLEYIKYCCNPELLAYRAYGSEELAFLILIVNGIPAGSSKEFTNRKFNMIPPDLALYALNTIANKEKELLDYNDDTLGE